MSIQVNTDTAHDTDIVTRINAILNLYGNDASNVLAIILEGWADDQDLESIAEYLEDRAIENGLKQDKQETDR